MVLKNLGEIPRGVLPEAHDDALVIPENSSRSLAARASSWIPFALILISIGLVAQVTLLSPHQLAWNSWAYSEWLINYDAGFIRRGLSGSLIDQVRQMPALQVVNVVVFVVFTAFCLLFWWVLRQSARSTTWAIILAMLVPNGPVQMALGNEIFYRKEIVFHVALGIHCIIYRMIVNAPTDARRVLLSWIFFVLLLAQTLVFPLFHEVYLFLSFPACWLLARQVAGMQPQRRVFGWLPSVAVLLSLGMMVVCTLFRGNPAAAQQIWNSLSGPDRMFISPSAPDTPTGGIDAIGWSALQNLSVIGDMMMSSVFWVWGFAAVGIGAVLVLATSLRRDPGEADGVSTELLRRHLSQLWFLFVVSLPMYVIGSDWARWLSSIAISYLFLSFADSTGSIKPPQLGRLVPLRWRGKVDGTREYLTERLVPAINALSIRHKVASLMLALFFCLTFRPPECCMKGGYNPFYRMKPVLVELSHFGR